MRRDSFDDYDSDWEEDSTFGNPNQNDFSEDDTSFDTDSRGRWSFRRRAKKKSDDEDSLDGEITEDWKKVDDGWQVDDSFEEEDSFVGRQRRKNTGILRTAAFLAIALLTAGIVIGVINGTRSRKRAQEPVTTSAQVTIASQKEDKSDSVQPAEQTAEPPEPSAETVQEVQQAVKEQEAQPTSENHAVIDHSLDYDYNMLTVNQQKCYDQLCTELNLEKTVITVTAQTYDDVEAALNAVRNDRPEYFWLWSWNSQWSSSETGVNVTITTDSYSESDVQRMAQEIRQKVREIVPQFQGLSDYEKVKGIYTYLIDHTVYDYDYDMQNCYQALLQGRAVCTGYARSLQLLLRELGVETIWVSNDEHSWDIVKIDGEYYHVDATHGDPLTDDGTQYLNYYYLNLTQEEITSTGSHQLTGLNHSIPYCTATTYNYYRHEGLLITDKDREQVTALLQRVIAEQSNIVTFRAEDKQVFNWLKQTYCKGSGVAETLEELGYECKGISYSIQEELMIFEINLKLFGG